jgi:succinate dehydrogenase/fumarate reductase flavoprotein subunit
MDSENSKTPSSVFQNLAKVAGAAMAVPLVMGMNANAAESSSIQQEVVETDLLIIGGGIAGIFAALKAKEEGVNATIVDKGTVGRSGLSPWFGAYNYCHPEKSDPKATWLKVKAAGGEYLTNLDYVEHFVDDSQARYQDMVTYGADKANKGGHVAVFRDILLKKGIKLVERVMVTELIKSNDKVCGAVGFSLDTDNKAVVFKAKAVLLCSGSGALKPSGFPVAPLTHDGDGMAFRAGAEISGKEFVDFHWTHTPYPAAVYLNWQSDFGHELNVNTNATFNGPGPVAMVQAVDGGQIPYIMGTPGGSGSSSGGGRPDGDSGGGTRPDGDSGGGARPSGGSSSSSGGPSGAMPPGIRDFSLPLLGGSTAGMSAHKCEGIFPKNAHHESSLEGLFAAGDALCSSGATYHGFGSSSSESAVQGHRASTYACEYVKSASKPKISDSQINKIIATIFEPRTNTQGFNPEWVTLVLQSMMTPYYVLYLKSKERLEAALTNVQFLRDKFASYLIASNAHELRQALEVKNMILNSEMKLRAGLMRTESRGAHYREDYPEKDDDNWLAWIVISKDGDSMKLKKKEVPDEWKPNSKLTS